MPSSCHKRVVNTETQIIFMQLPNRGVQCPFVLKDRICVWADISFLKSAYAGADLYLVRRRFGLTKPYPLIGQLHEYRLGFSMSPFFDN